jgi:hypothetical protein
MNEYTNTPWRVGESSSSSRAETGLGAPADDGRGGVVKSSSKITKRFVLVGVLKPSTEFGDDGSTQQPPHPII